MATVEQCQQALDTLAEKMAAAADRGVQTPTLDRSVMCRIPDLNASFQAHLSQGRLQEITPGEDPRAQITLTVNSDDLVALTDGSLNFASAWATNRLRVDAAFMDLLKLRSLF